MAWGRNARARFAWASADTSAPPPGQVLPPPIPGGSTRYYTASENGIYPWAVGGFAGARNPVPALTGGVVAVPDAESGTVAVTVWWPFATILLLVRRHPDGSVVPVRGGYALRVPTATRRNFATNPSVEAGLNGWLPKDGNPTLTQGQGGAAAGNYFARATTTNVPGANGVGIPTSLTGALPLTVGFSWRARPATPGWRPTSITLKIAWTDAIGGALATSTAVLSADQLAAGVDQWARPVVSLTPPAGAVTPTVSLVAAGMPVGSTLDVDAVTIEQGVTDGSAFDGGSLGATWAGAEGLSESVQAPLMTVIDRECPLDVDVSYIVVSPGLTGGRVTSDLVQLPSLWRTWLTHPDPDTAPMRVDLAKPPALEFGAEQGVFWPLGATRPVVISALRRQAPTGSVVFNVSGWDERDRLRELLADMAPVLLRAPAAYGYGPGQWLSLGAVTEDRGERKAWQDAAQLSATFVEVDPPDPVT